MTKLNNKIPQGLGVRQPSGALASPTVRSKSGRGLPQSKTLSRVSDGLNDCERT